METRPRIKLTLSPFDKTLEWAGKVLLLLMWGLTIFALCTLPDIIPIHFNAAGQADNHGNKITLLVLPVLGTILYFGMTELNKYPHIFNYLTQITADNAERQYSMETRMLRFLKSAILLIFSMIILLTYLAATGSVNGLGAWFLPVILGIILLPTIILIIQSQTKKKLG